MAEGSGAPDPVETAALRSEHSRSAIIRSARHRRRSLTRELPLLVVGALVLALLLKAFVVQAFSIPSPSMEPTLLPGDRVLVNELGTRFGNVHRGDVIVFTDPHPAAHDAGVLVDALRWLADGIGITRPSEQDFIKRVIGLPGDLIEIRRGDVYVNGRRRSEPYLDPALDRRSFGPYRVPAGMLFVLGDNRTQSEDSRFPSLGYVPRERVVGRAVAIAWPPSRSGWL